MTDFNQVRRDAQRAAREARRQGRQDRRSLRQSSREDAGKPDVSVENISSSVLSATPGLIQSFASTPENSGQKASRVAGLTVQGAELGAVAGPLGAAIGAGVGLIGGLVTGNGSMRKAQDKRTLLAEKTFSDDTEQLNKEFFLNQGFHSTESARDILRKASGLV